MKHVKKTLATALLLSACSGKNEANKDIVGEWEMTSFTCADGTSVRPQAKIDGGTWRFTSDKKTVLQSYAVKAAGSVENNIFGGEYSTDGDVLVLVGEDGVEDKIKFAVSNGNQTLTITQIEDLDSPDSPCANGVASVGVFKKIGSASSSNAKGQNTGAAGMQGFSAADLSADETAELQGLSPEQIEAITKEMSPTEKTEFMRILEAVKAKGGLKQGSNSSEIESVSKEIEQLRSKPFVNMSSENLSRLTHLEQELERLLKSTN